MTDFEYDCIQKKRLAQMARHRKCGSKSKKCTLPSDHMTHKQWKERCGEVMTYNLNEPKSWAQFKEMPNDLQKEYLSYLCENYNVNATSLSQMFGMTAATVRSYIKEVAPEITFARGSRMTDDQRVVWEKFISGDVVSELEDETSASPILPENDELTGVEEAVEGIVPVHAFVLPAQTKDSMKLSQFSLSFSGPIDVMAIANSIQSMIGSEANGRVEIMCVLD